MRGVFGVFCAASAALVAETSTTYRSRTREEKGSNAETIKKSISGLSVGSVGDGRRVAIE